MYGRAGSDLLSKRGILHPALPESQTRGRAYFRVDANVRTSRWGGPPGRLAAEPPGGPM